MTTFRQYRKVPPVMGFMTGLCSSEKRSYYCKDGAKAVVKKMKGEGQKGVRAYYCDECDHWHAGHLPEVVRRGEYTAGEIYRRPAS